MGHPLVLATIVVVVCLLALKAMRSSGTHRHQYQRNLLITKNEARLFRLLVREFPDFYVFPQVGMSALVKPAYGQADKRYVGTFRTMSQKRVDFVMCKGGSLDVSCIIELDDRSHDPTRDQRRDSITMAAG